MLRLLENLRLRPAWAWLGRHVRTVGIAMATVSLCNLTLFLVLATSAGLGWWRPGWNAATERILCGLLIGLSSFFGLFYMITVRYEARLARRGIDRKAGLTMLGHAESVVLCGLAAAWGVTAWAGHPSRRLLFLIPLMLAVGSVAMVALAFRHQRCAAE